MQDATEHLVHDTFSRPAMASGIDQPIPSAFNLVYQYKGQLHLFSL